MPTVILTARATLILTTLGPNRASPADEPPKLKNLYPHDRYLPPDRRQLPPRRLHGQDLPGRTPAPGILQATRPATADLDAAATCLEDLATQAQECRNFIPTALSQVRRQDTQ